MQIGVALGCTGRCLKNLYGAVSITRIQNVENFRNDFTKDHFMKEVFRAIEIMKFHAITAGQRFFSAGRRIGRAVFFGPCKSPLENTL